MKLGLLRDKPDTNAKTVSLDAIDTTLKTDEHRQGTGKNREKTTDYQIASNLASYDAGFGADADFQSC
jgi:hypothetical protein